MLENACNVYICLTCLIQGTCIIENYIESLIFQGFYMITCEIPKLFIIFTNPLNQQNIDYMFG